MKNIYKSYHIGLLLVLLLVIGCDEEKLNKQPSYTFTTGALWANKEGAELALTGIYGRLQVNWVGIKTFQQWAAGLHGLRRCRSDPLLSVLRVSPAPTL